MRHLLLLLAAIFATPASAAPAKDWTQTATATPGGSHILGNPAAKARLTEYVSFTCPHCAHFVAEASQPLKDGWVKRGALSVELRHAIRDPYDLTAALLARCAGPAQFWATAEALFANQEAWMPRVEAYEQKRAGGEAPGGDALLPDIARQTGLTDLMEKRGVPAARQRVCLTDKKALASIAAMTKDAWETKKIGGTPAFALNGKMVDGAHDWASLRAQLPASPK